MNGNVPALSRRGFRLTAAIVAGVCVLAIAVGVVAFSYSDVRELALTAGLTPRLARFYPLVFDAVLIVACAAAVTLRGVPRVLAWLAVLVVVGAMATAETVHAMSITVPKRPLDATIAIAPWVVLLTGLILLDAMFRRAPGRRTETVGPVSANGRGPAAGSPESAARRPAGAGAVPLSTLFYDSPRGSASRSRTAASQPAADARPAPTTASQPAADASPAPTTASQPAADASPAPTTASEPPAGPGEPEATASPPLTGADPSAADPYEDRPREG